MESLIGSQTLRPRAHYAIFLTLSLTLSLPASLPPSRSLSLSRLLALAGELRVEGSTPNPQPSTIKPQTLVGSQALHMFERLEDDHGISICYENLGDTYMKMAEVRPVRSTPE